MDALYRYFDGPRVARKSLKFSRLHMHESFSARAVRFEELGRVLLGQHLAVHLWT